MSTYSLQPNHLSFILVCVSLNSSSFLELQALPSLLHHSVALYQTARAVNFILSLALLYMNTFIATPTSICGFYVGTQPPPAGYLEYNVCF